jgi:hypothetical protein
LEYPASLVKLAQKERDDNLKSTNLIKSNEALVICKICINKSHRSRMLHLLVGVGNNMVEGFVDIGASMSIMSIIIVCELGIMYMVTSTKFYKIASRVVT